MSFMKLLPGSLRTFAFQGETLLIVGQEMERTRFAGEVYFVRFGESCLIPGELPRNWAIIACR